MSTLPQRYTSQIRGTLSCFDSIVLTGILPGICYARGMQASLHSKDIRLVDYPRFAEPFCDQVRHTIEQTAREAGLAIEFVRSPNAFRNEVRVQQSLAARGGTAGIVPSFSAMEACPTYGICTRVVVPSVGAGQARPYRVIPQDVPCFCTRLLA